MVFCFGFERDEMVNRVHGLKTLDFYFGFLFCSLVCGLGWFRDSVVGDGCNDYGEVRPWVLKAWFGIVWFCFLGDGRGEFGFCDFAGISLGRGLR